jgi:hypothetical protein
MVDENLTQEPELDPGRPRHLDGAQSFDGQDHVISATAWDLHLGGGAHSARSSHPGFVPDTYVDDLDTETATTFNRAGELRVWGGSKAST